MSITLDLPKSVEKQYTKEQLKAILTAYILFLQKQQELLKPKKREVFSKFEIEDDFVPTEEFLDFREIDLKELPKDFRNQLLETNARFDRGELTFVK